VYVGAVELDVLFGDVQSLKRDVLDACERLVAGRPELELLTARHRMLGPDDD